MRTGSYEAKTRRDEDSAIMQIIQKAILVEGRTAATVSYAVCERIDVDFCPDTALGCPPHDHSETDPKSDLE